MALTAQPLLEVQSVRQAFPRPDGSQLLVLDDLNLTLAEGEIVGLLGRSGSGKSTLLRLIAGLAKPSAGSQRGVFGSSFGRGADPCVLIGPAP